MEDFTADFWAGGVKGNLISHNFMNFHLTWFFSLFLWLSC